MASGRTTHSTEAVERSALLVGLMFLVKGLETVSDRPLSGYGIVPRTEAGLAGILFSPLLHASWGHLLANSIPLFVLLLLLLGDRHYYPYRTLALIWLASGLGTWLIGRPQTVHIGASSLVFGLVVYLIVAGLLMGSWRSIVISLIVFFFFGGILWGILPRAGPISWEGHLSGAVAGAYAAKRNHGPRKS